MSNEAKHITEVSQVVQTDQGVRIEVTSEEEGMDEAVEYLVQTCQGGQCNCLNPEMKQRISGMEFQKIEGRTAIAITGDVSAEEIRGAMEGSNCLVGKSLLKNKSCC